MARWSLLWPWMRSQAKTISQKRFLDWCRVCWGKFKSYLSESNVEKERDCIQDREMTRTDWLLPCTWLQTSIARDLSLSSRQESAMIPGFLAGHLEWFVFPPGRCGKREGGDRLGQVMFAVPLSLCPKRNLNLNAFWSVISVSKVMQGE